jgi:hypothetical protein
MSLKSAIYFLAAGALMALGTEAVSRWLDGRPLITFNK